MASPVFNQNLYQGVYDTYQPEVVPEDLDLFKINAEKYPLLEEVKKYILEATLNKGDCIYVPSMWWTQFKTVS